MADIITPFTTTTASLPRVVVNVRDVSVPRCPICGGANYQCVG